jgi:uncharacterized membrane protein
MEICGTNYIPHLGMEKVGVAQSVGHLTSVCHTNGILRHECHRIFIIYCILVYTPFGNGGRGCSVCLSFDIRLSHQWNFAARMSQNFHHILYISDYNVSPMEICGKNYIPHLRMEKVRVARSVCCSMSVCHTNGILRHKCHRIFIIYCILVTTMSHQWKSVARMSQNFRHYSIPHMGMEKGRVTPSVLWSMSVSHTNRNLRHKCHRIFIIYCILVTTMSHQYIPHLGKTTMSSPDAGFLQPLKSQVMGATGQHQCGIQI